MTGAAAGRQAGRRARHGPETSGLVAFAALGYFYYTFAPGTPALPAGSLAVANDLRA